MIYITGNTHGDLSRFFKTGIKKMKENDILIICGDFGFIWDGSENEKKNLEQIGKFKFKTLFVDGTHENFDILDKYENIKIYDNTAKHIKGNLYQLMRGKVYNIENNIILTFGGGESDDKDMRVELNTWWKEEMPTIMQMKAAVEELNKVNRSVDFIVTHEPPLHIKNLINQSCNNINQLNTFFEDLSKQVEYNHWFFGSLHIDKKFSRKFSSIFNDIYKLNDFKKI